MNCTDFLAKLTDYFDGQIDPDLLAEVKQHLGTCHHCEVVVDTTRKTIDVYPRQPDLRPPRRPCIVRMKAAVMERCIETGRLPNLDIKGKTKPTTEEFLKEQTAQAKH